MTTMSSADYRAMMDKPRSKYNNRRVCLDGYAFDSQAEARRYVWLRDEQQQGHIAGLRVHPRYELQPKFTDNTGKKHRAIYYEADFAYAQGGRQVVEDVKGKRTGAFNIKEKLFLFRYPEYRFDVVEARAA